MSDILPILIAGYSIAVFGFVSSVISLWLIYKIAVLHNGFGLISAAQSIVEGSILFFNVFVAYSLIVLNPNGGKSFSIIFIGLIAAFCNPCVSYLQLLKAFNRSFAIIFPTEYKNIFTVKKSAIYIFVIFIISLFHVLHNLISSCYFIMNESLFSWGYSTSNCTKDFAYLIPYWSRLIILGVTLLFDGITLFYLRMFRKKIIRLSDFYKTIFYMRVFLEHDKKIMTAEIRFFFQTFLTSTFYLIMVVSPRILRPYADTPFLLYLTSSATLLLFHATNEFFFIIFTIFISKSMKKTSNVAVMIPPKN